MYNKETSVKKNYLIVMCITILVFIWGYFYGFGWLVKRLSESSWLYTYKFSEIIAKFLIYVGLIFIWILILFPIIRNDISLYKKEYFNEVFTVVTIALLCCIPLVFLRSLFNSNTVENNLFEKAMIMEIALKVFSSLVYAPIVEELFCIGALNYVLQHNFLKDDIKRIVLIATMFSLLHIFKMQNGIIDIVFYFMVYFVLGMSSGYLYYKTKNILCSCLVHFVWNAYMIVGVLIRFVSG